MTKLDDGRIYPRQQKLCVDLAKEAALSCLFRLSAVARTRSVSCARLHSVTFAPCPLPTAKHAPARLPIFCRPPPKGTNVAGSCQPIHGFPGSEFADTKKANNIEFRAQGGIVMRFSSRVFVANSCIALLMCGFGGPAVSQTATSTANATRTLPTVTVNAPTVRPRSRAQAVVRGVVHRTSTTTAQTILAASTSDFEKLAMLANITGSCVGGCVTSFRSGNDPWHGCSVSSWPSPSPTCRNVAGFKTYEECRGIGLLMGWRGNEIPWYCSSLALK